MTYRCGHTAVTHNGHLHHVNGGHIEEHTLEAGAANPSACTPNHSCNGHETGHVHGPTCGHEREPHDGHVDYLVSGHLHHPHGRHCDDYGKLERPK